MLQTGQVAVLTTPTPVVQCTSPGSLALTNTGAAAVFIGGPNVSTANGTPIPAGQVLPLAEVGNSGPIFAIAAATGNVLGFAYGTRS